MTSPGILDVLLLIALPAAGKSEVRRYLSSLDAETLRDELHLGDIVELDDYPYVHAMRRIDEELARLGRQAVFFQSLDSSFIDLRDWGTLAVLLNQDFSDLVAGRRAEPSSAAEWLLDRFDEARRRVGASAPFDAPESRTGLVPAIAEDAAQLLEERNRGIPLSLEGKTVVIELSRGGPVGAPMPLDPPRGYRHSLSLFDPDILARAAVLYVWVSPEESRRKNIARADPAQPGSILHHGVPESVMVEEYGCDDLGWMLERSNGAGTVRIETRGATFDVPTVRFDNRDDRTSFLRAARDQWSPSAVRTLHTTLREGMDQLARRRFRGRMSR